MWRPLVMCVLYTMFIQSEAKDEDLMCGVCMAVVNDIGISIKSQDPKRTVQVGSFRVDSKGNQPNLKEIPYGRSEVFLTELFEKLCDKMNQFGVSVNPDTKKRSVIRKYNLDNSMSGLNLDEKLNHKLKYVCSDFLEEYEEEAIPVLQQPGEKGDEDNTKKLCVDILNVCSQEEMESQKSAQSAGIRSAIFDKANNGDGVLNLSPGGGGDDEVDEGDGDDDDESNTEDDIKEESAEVNTDDTQENKNEKEEL